MSAETKNTPVTENDEQYSLSDDRRVKVLSPGAMVMKRFFRNRLSILAAEDTSVTFPAPFQYQVQHALAGGGGSFSYEGSDYAVDPEGVVTQDGEPYAVCSPYIIQSKTPAWWCPRSFAAC